MGIGTILDIGSSGLFSFRIGVQVHSNNIANVDTPGYTRKRVVLQERIPPERIAVGFVGRGVDVQRIQSIRDDNLQKSVHAKTSDLYDFDTRMPLLGQIERLFNTDEDFGLTAALNRFWNAWDDLATQPQGEAQRSNLVAETQTLVNYFHDITQDLDNLDTYINTQMEAAVTAINGYVDSIVELNERINQLEIDGEEAGSERDQRNAEMTELAKLIGYSYFESDDGTVSIILPNGKPLVSGLQGHHLGFSSGTITWATDGSDITSSISGGQMGGWLEIKEAVITEFQANFDELAKGLIFEVNKLHAQGVGLNAMSTTTGTTRVTDQDTAISSLAGSNNFFGEVSSGSFKVYIYDSNGTVVSHLIDVDPSVMTVGDLIGQLNAITGLSATTDTDDQIVLTADSGYSFAFGEVNTDILAALGINTFFDGYDADTIDVNTFIVNNHNQIAAGQVDDKTGAIDPGDNSNALDIAALRTTKKSDFTWWTYTRDGGTSQTVNLTIDEYLASIVGRAGVMAANNKTDRDFNNMLLNQFEELLGETSGVNLDEELIEILRYQRAYQTSARLITVADEMLQTLIQM